MVGGGSVVPYMDMSGRAADFKNLSVSIIIFRKEIIVI